MARANDDLTAEPLSDAGLLDLDALLRRDVVRKDQARPLLLMLRARCLAAEAALAAVKEQPRRDELAREVTRLEQERAALERVHTQCAAELARERALHGQAADAATIARAERDLAYRELDEMRAAHAAAIETLRADLADEMARELDAARAREAALAKRVDAAERLSGERDALRARTLDLEAQVAALQQQVARRARAAADARATLDALLAGLESS